MTNFNLEISIPADDDGFILMKCPLCGGFFKLTPYDIEAEDALGIWCPCCGLKSENYLTDDVTELALKMAENNAMEHVFKEMKKWERKFKGNGLSFKAGKKPTSKPEDPVVAGIEILEIQNYECCKRQAKIKPIVKMIGSYCPFCGVNYDGNQ
ncbi:TFIIB-type zinc ribbon-containing protein [Exiguobacterium sp. s22]|uniref:TFIIB-type zinc ribbon-containing protein n=1 Tax=Exiguobacterium sp. s22 TaxID=2751272 RepID=UPI001BE73EAD|nr:TFIIB-type zinc ribbon-containing protein [Exiguobacterium sp. s22]